VQQSVDRLALELLLQHEELSKWIADEPYDSAWLHLSEVSPKVPESFEAQSGEVNLLQLTDDAWIAALDDEELIALAHGCTVSSSASAMADDATHMADDATESHEPGEQPHTTALRHSVPPLAMRHSVPPQFQKHRIAIELLHEIQN
jgi:hypothetical protein